MITNQERPNDHETFDELCALAMSGALSAGEWADLKHHLKTCEECREVYDQYLVVTRDCIPILSAGYDHGEEQGSWDDSAVRQKLFARVAAEEEQARVAPLVNRVARPLNPHVRPRISVHPLARAAVAACIILVAGAGAFRLGRRTEVAATHADASADARFEKLAAEKRSVDELLNAQTQKLAQLLADRSHEEEEVQKLRSALRTVEDRSSELTVARRASEEQLRAVSQERGVIAGQLHDAQQAYQAVQAELVSLRAQQDKARLQLTSLENEVSELSSANREQQRQINESAQFLSSDRDIRELMGARQLYIADVFDVASDSHTRRPFGRVFYTKGKSLIFYAFDLDHQPRVKNAAFQAWGSKEADQGRPLNLGILYMDNETNRRWALRCDDPKRLAEIDAIFVTVEPKGGSNKPTGKPFLYASLRREANHP